MSPQTFFDQVITTVGASSLPVVAAWGAAGGLTSALAITGQRRRDIVRQVLLGALVASGLGAAAGAVMAAWLGFPAEAAIPLTAAGSSSAYLSGVFGPAIFEVILSRIRSGRLPGEDGR